MWTPPSSLILCQLQKAAMKRKRAEEKVELETEPDVIPTKKAAPIKRKGEALFVGGVIRPGFSSGQHELMCCVCPLAEVSGVKKATLKKKLVKMDPQMSPSPVKVKRVRGRPKKTA